MLKQTRQNIPLLLALVSCLALSRFVIGWSPQQPAPPSVKGRAVPVQSARPAKADPRVAAKPADLRVRQGALRVLDKEGVKAECPLRHTDVQAEISGFIARVSVTQEFHNPFDERIEAIYVFPLSQEAAVDDMTVIVGARQIRGQIKPRAEARRIYEEAKAAGHMAGLLDQERPNIFTQSLANIQPGEEIKVQIRYVELLPYEDGVYRFVFPMVVGPRYIPGAMAVGKQGTGWAPDTDRVPDASKITPPVTPEGTRAGHDIAITVALDAGVPVDAIRSTLHEIDVERLSAHAAVVRLRDQETIPNKDFILTYEVAGEDIADAVLAHATPERGAFFSLIVQPPERVPAEKITPKEMIFVIDTSGSQMGWPIEKAKETMAYCLQHMNSHDTFQLLGFSNEVVPLFDRPQPNTPENRQKGLEFLATRTGQGGTELLKAVLAALAPPPDPERLRIVCFMTDGYVGNDLEIIAAVKKHLGSARFFSFGVGNAVNRFLLDKMAEFGRGAVEYVTLNQSGEEVARRFHDRIANPVLTDIAIDWGGLPVHDLYPTAIPDLFSAKPLVIKGRYTGAGSGRIFLRGKVAGKPFYKDLWVDLPARVAAHDALATLWARARIDDLMSQDFYGMQSGRPRSDLKEMITQLGLDFRLMTQYTSFVAVEERTVMEGGRPKTITVPVEMPEGVSYDGIFGPGGSQQAFGIGGGRGGGIGPGTGGGVGRGTGIGVAGPYNAGGVAGGVPGGVVGGVVGGVSGGVLGSSAPTLPPPPGPTSIDLQKSMAPAAKHDLDVRVPPPPPMPKVRPQPYTIGSDVMQTNLIKQVQPIYPSAAKRARISGIVILQVRVGETGLVEEATVLRGHPLLSDATVEAVKQWAYQPVLLNGQPVPVTATVTVNFALPDSDPRVHQKMDPALIGLAEVFAREGKDGYLNRGAVEIKDGKVEVTVWLTDALRTCRERLAAVQFEPLTAAPLTRTVRGRIPVGRLEALARLDCVARLAPAAAAR